MWPSITVKPGPGSGWMVDLREELGLMEGRAVRGQSCGSGMTSLPLEVLKSKPNRSLLDGWGENSVIG